MNLQTINDVANEWEKTKDPKLKEKWYKLVREFHESNSHIIADNEPNGPRNTTPDSRS
jgi:hypothetical protein